MSIVIPLLIRHGSDGYAAGKALQFLPCSAQLGIDRHALVELLLAGEAAGAGVLAFGLLLGYAAALVPFVHGLSRIGKVLPIRLAACLRPASAATLRQALHLSLPLLATILVGQWGIVVVNRALSEMPPGTLADFGYAWKLLMLAGLLPAALATVIFPAFSDAHANRDTAELSRLAMRALRMTLLLTLPLAMFLWVERTPLVGLIFGRGGMSEAALDETGRLFAILLVGAPVGVPKNSKPCAAKSSGSLRSRGTVSRRAIESGTFQ